MPLFRYTVADKSGKTLNGVMQAVDEADLGRRLASMGFALQAAVAAGGAAAQPAASQPSVRTAVQVDRIPPSLEPRIPMRTLAAYLRQMAALIRSGLGPYQATNAILTRTPNRRLRRALQDMEDQVRGGGALSPVMAAYPGIFPTKVVGLVYCGELGGFLDKALDEAATHIEDETKARLWPRIAVGFLRICVVWSLITLPAVRADVWMDKLLNMSGGGTRYLLHYYLNGLLRVSLPLILIFLALTYIWPHVKRIPSVRSAFDLVILKAPIWGALHKSRALARFGRSLAELYSAAVPPAPAWNAASYSCPNSILANKLRSVGQTLIGGGTLSEALAGSRVFDRDTEALIMTGEQAGDIPGVLQKVAEYNEGFAVAQHRKGRWISISAGINAFLIMGGILTIIFFAGYAKVLKTLLDQALGGE
ncbi:MAG: type II secretion system F family protein [Armatimonadota bacterium]|nr:type II secretion system F family protein [Armatimonadota bacterium]